MSDFLDPALSNLGSPLILAFVLGAAAALVRSDLNIPEAAAKFLSIYLLFAIGFKGGVIVAERGLSVTLATSLLAGIAMSAALPFIAFGLLRILTRLDRINAAAVAGHYGSISIVTFVAGTSLLEGLGLKAEGYMVAVAAAMEAPAILSALWLMKSDAGGESRMDSTLWREILLNGSIVLLAGSFLIGMISGTDGLKEIEAFVVTPFKGVLCLFLLDMGLIAGRGLRERRGAITRGLVLFGVIMPVIGSVAGVMCGLLLGLTTGGVFLFMVLCASASYIAVPAAMRVAAPEADPGIYLTLSLGITFPFNLTIGLPLYLGIARALTGG